MCRSFYLLLLIFYVKQVPVIWYRRSWCDHQRQKFNMVINFCLL